LTKKDSYFATFGPYQYADLMSVYVDRYSLSFVSVQWNTKQFQVWDTRDQSRQTIPLPINVKYVDAPGDFLVDPTTKSNSIFAISIPPDFNDDTLLLIATEDDIKGWTVIAQVHVPFSGSQVSVRSRLVASSRSYFDTNTIFIYRCKASNMLLCDSKSWEQEMLPSTFPHSGLVKFIDDNTLLCASLKGPISIWKYSLTSQSWGQTDELPFTGDATLDVNQNHLILQGNFMPVNLYSITDGKFMFVEKVTPEGPIVVSLSADSKYAAVVTMNDVLVYRREETWVLFQTIPHSYGRNANFIGFTLANDGLVFSDYRSVNVFFKLNNGQLVQQ